MSLLLLLLPKAQPVTPTAPTAPIQAVTPTLPVSSLILAGQKGKRGLVRTDTLLHTMGEQRGRGLRGDSASSPPLGRVALTYPGLC